MRRGLRRWKRRRRRGCGRIIWRGLRKVIGARGTIDVFRPAPFGIANVLDAFDLRDQTSLYSAPRSRSVASRRRNRKMYQKTAKALAQPGEQVALGVAPAITRVTKPTWNMKQQLVRQQECGHQELVESDPVRF